MIFQILDRQFNNLATMDNSLTGAIHFFNDEFHQYLKEGMATFDFSILTGHVDAQYLIEGNYIQFTYKSRDYLMTIRRIEQDETTLNVFTEDLGFDLLNEFVPAYKAPKARKVVEYLNDILANSGVQIGLNEVSSYTRTLEWEGDSTVLERVLSIVNYFDAECEFITELNNDRSIKQITLNIYHKRDDGHQGVGVDRTDIELRYGENVKTVKKTTDITSLYTRIKPIGRDGLTIKDKEETIKDEYGNVIFYTKKGSEWIYAPVANQRFGNTDLGEEGFIDYIYDYDTDNVNTLYGNALSQIKIYSEPAVTYEVEGYYDLNIGDVVSIADNKYNPVLLLEARASEMVISFTSPDQNKTVFSNYRVFESQISDDLLDRMDKLKEDVDYAIQVAKTPIFKISTVGSTVFKNGEGSVKLVAAVERANADVTEEYSVFNWIKQNKDGSVDAEWSAAHEDFGTTLTISPDDFADTATFSYVAVKDGETFTGGGATVVKIFDGEDGKTPVKGVDYFDGVDGADGKTAYIHIRYSQSADGTGMTENPAGAVYVGLQTSQNPTASTVPADYMWSKIKGQDGIAGETGADGKTSYLHIKYSDDGGKTFTANGGETAGSYMGQYVDFTQADSTDPTKYTWSKIKGEQGPQGVAGLQGPKGDTGPQGPTGPKGDRGIMGVAYMQPTQPSDTTEGATWFKTESATSDKIIGVYTYKSGWQPKKYASATLAVEELSALSANLGNVTAGTINGVVINSSVFNSSGEFDSQGTTLEFTSKNMGTIETDWKVKGGTQNGKMIVSPTGISSTSWTDAAKTTPAWFYELHNGGLYVGDGKSRSDIDASNSASYGLNGITITNKMYNAQYGSVALGFQDLMTMPKTPIPALSGFTQYSSDVNSANCPTAQRQGRVVQLAGAFRNSNDIAANSGTIGMGMLPVWARPSTGVNVLVQGTGHNIYLLGINTEGRLSFDRYRGDTGSSNNYKFDYKTCGAGAWLNIAVVYAAGDL